MVVINLLTSALILIGIFCYVYFYPKKRVNIFILMLIISLLPIINIFRQGAYESGDFTIHIYRTIDFFHSLEEGNIMPSWAENLNAHYGYPLFLFNYLIPYYILSLFHVIGFSFITSMKLFLAVSFILSGIGMYVFIKKLCKNDLAAFTAGVFYLFTPYHLIDLHFKVVIGELMVFMFLPYVFFFTVKSYETKKIVYFLWSGLFLSFLLLSHVVIGLFVMLLLSLFVLNQYKKTNIKNVQWKDFVPYLIAIILSSSAWLPPFLLSQHSFIKTMKITTVYFPTLSDMLFAPWRYGFLFQGPYGEISHIIGYTQLGVLSIYVFALIFNRIKKQYKSIILFWALSSCIIIFFISPYAKFIWQLTPMISITGSHRLLVLLTFTISVLAGFLPMTLVKKKVFIFLLIAVTIGYTILNWGQRRVIPTINDRTLIQNVPYSTATGEGHFYANTRWVDTKRPWFNEVPKKSIEILKGFGSIKQINRTSTNHKYFVDAKTSLSIQENTLYYPLWRVTANNQTYTIKPNKKGVMTFNLPKGKYTLDIRYADSPGLLIIKIFTILGFLLVIFLFFLLK